MPSNFYANIHQQLHLHYSKVLVVWPGKEETLSYTGKDLLQKIAIIRAKLHKQHIKSADKVLPALPIGLDLFCGVLAIMSIGAIPVLPPARSQPLDIIQLIRKHNIKGIITPQQVRWPLPVLSWLLRVKVISPELIDSVDEDFEVIMVSPEQAALISHSSGSTGAAKAISRSHQVLSAQHQVLKAAFPPLPDQRDLPLFPNILLHNLSIGYTSVLPDVPWRAMETMEAAKVISQIEQEQIHTLTGNVFYFNKLLTYLESHPKQFNHVAAVGIGGSPVPETLLHALKRFFPKAEIYVIYGSSEAEPIAIRKVGENKASPQAGYTVGTIVESLNYRIDPIGMISIGKVAFPVGEIQVKGSHVAISDKKSWLNTGDFGYIDAANQLVLTGRQGNETMHQGTMHYQIEHVLIDQCQLKRVAALSKADGFDIFIEGQADVTSLRQVLTAVFPDISFKEFYFREALPVDTRHFSKILYNQLF